VADQPPIYVLDSFALLAYLEAEPSGPVVLGLFEAARDGEARLYLSTINAGEVYYILMREQGAESADSFLGDLNNLPIALCSATDDRVWAAARLKAEHAISYADAFAAALAIELKATLVTGDPEFTSLTGPITIQWLQRK
jgi:predicted nucleic acid-binding protein